MIGRTELCEGPSGEAICTDEHLRDGLCNCITFDCDSRPGCNCSSCATILGCDASCGKLHPVGLVHLVATASVLNPIVLVVTTFFKWLHGPVIDAVHDAAAQPMQHAKDAVVAERRSMHSARLVYATIILLACFCVFIIVAISRQLSAPMTLQWLGSACGTLAMKWAVTDPLKVTALSLVHSWAAKREWTARLISWAHTLCLGDRSRTGKARFRSAVHLVMNMENSLHSVHERLLQQKLQQFFDDEARDMALRHATEEAAIRQASSTQEVRRRLAEKQRGQRLQLQQHVERADEILSLVVAEQDDPFQHLPDDARSATDAQSDPDAHSLMEEYSAEAARLVAAQESEHAASLVRLSSRRQQRQAQREHRAQLRDAVAKSTHRMAQKVASLECLLASGKARRAAVERKVAKALPGASAAAVQKVAKAANTANLLRALEMGDASAFAHRPTDDEPEPPEGLLPHTPVATAPGNIADPRADSGRDSRAAWQARVRQLTAAMRLSDTVQIASHSQADADGAEEVRSGERPGVALGAHGTADRDDGLPATPLGSMQDFQRSLGQIIANVESGGRSRWE